MLEKFPNDKTNVAVSHHVFAMKKHLERRTVVIGYFGIHKCIKLVWI